MRLGFNPIEGKFDFKAPHEQVTDTIPAFSSNVVDSIDLSDFFSLEYSFHLTNGTKVRSFKCIVTYDNGFLTDQVYSRSGSLNVGIDIVINGVNMDLQITNNEASEVDLTLTRLIL